MTGTDSASRCEQAVSTPVSTKAPFMIGRGSLAWEPPIGIEPMTYALREGREASSAVQAVTIGPLRQLPAPGPSTPIQACC
jgi:hypothetical protein